MCPWSPMVNSFTSYIKINIQKVMNEETMTFYLTLAMRLRDKCPHGVSLQISFISSLSVKRGRELLWKMFIL